MKSRKSNPVISQWNPRYHTFCIGPHLLEMALSNPETLITFKYEETKGGGVKRNWVQKQIPATWVFQHLTDYKQSKWNHGDFYRIKENLIFNYGK